MKDYTIDANNDTAREVILVPPYFFGYNTESFNFPKQSQKSRSILLDGLRSLGLFRRGKTHILAKIS